MNIDALLIEIGNALGQKVGGGHRHTLLWYLAFSGASALVALAAREGLAQKRRQDKQVVSDISGGATLCAQAFFDTPEKQPRSIKAKLFSTKPSVFTLELNDSASHPHLVVLEFSSLGEVEWHLEQHTSLRMGDFK